jgi:hypothetical protein
VVGKVSRQGLITTRVWDEVGQSKWAEVVVRSKRDMLFRSRIRRNAYDDQSTLVVEMWMVGKGWTEVLTRAIAEYPDVQALSYVNKPGYWERDIVLGCYRLLNEADTLFGGMDFAFLQPGKETVHV